jgi:hypothetical protein
MTSDTRVDKWLRMQQLTWDCDQGTRAVKIALEKPDGTVAYEWPASLEDLASVIVDGLSLQADELPTGGHQYRLVAYGENKAQLSELPQTIRGRSRDAASAGAEAMQFQKASQMALHNFEFSAMHLRNELEQTSKRLTEQVENTQALLEKCNELFSANFSSQLELKKFERSQERQDMLVQCLTPLITMAVQKYGPKLLNMNPDELARMIPASPPAAPPVAASPPAAPPVAASPPTPEVEIVVAPATIEPASATSVANAQSGSVDAARDSETGCAPNDRTGVAGRVDERGEPGGEPDSDCARPETGATRVDHQARGPADNRNLSASNRLGVVRVGKVNGKRVIQQR